MAREGPGVRLRVGADRTARLIAEWAGGTVASGRVDGARRAATIADRLPAGARQPPARDQRASGRTASSSSRASGSRRSPPRPDRDPGVGRAEAATTKPAPRLRSWRSSRRGAATSRSRPTSRRKWPASAATSRSRTSCRTRRCRSTATRRYRSATRSARRSPGPITEVVTHALVSPRIAEHFRWERPSDQEHGASEGGRPIAVTNPLSAGPWCCGRRSRQPRPDRVEPAPRRRRRRGFRDRQGLRRRWRRRLRRDAARVVAPRPCRHRRRRPGCVQPARTTSTT